MLTSSQLQQVMPHLPAAKLADFLPHINGAMQTFEVNNPLRAAAFLAQLAHESGEFRWMEEIWGPTDAQKRYEPPGTLATRLGNTQPGDGKRFKGRGPIQITGRFNYKRYGDLLHIDLLAQPERAAQPDVAFALAGLFWSSNHLNELADAQQFVAITKRINGGVNGLADRQKYYERAKTVLAGGTFGDAAPATRGSRGAKTTAAPDLGNLPPLTRGSEDIAHSEALAPAEDSPKAVAPARKRRTPAKSTAAAARPSPRTAKPAAKRRAPLERSTRP
ncbi:glycoside hydrolase family 19 protein [Variovorax defluvii]